MFGSVDRLNSAAVIPGPGKKNGTGRSGKDRQAKGERKNEGEKERKKERRTTRGGEKGEEGDEGGEEKKRRMGCVGGEREGRKKGTRRVKTPKLSGHCRLVSF